jgi:hypothetical protein
MNLIKFILLQILFNLCYSALIYKDIKFFNKLDFFNNLKQYHEIQNKEPIILNGIKTGLKKNFCTIFCNMNDIQFKAYSFDNFLLKKPHLKYENTMIYVKDYLVGNGRILNEFEKELMYGLKISSNMVILESENIELIPFKDFYLNRNFQIINFPIITKKDYIRYIYDVIIYLKYNDDLLLLNWSNYKIELLDFERINMLLFELDRMLQENLSLTDLHYYMEYIIFGIMDNY